MTAACERHCAYPRSAGICTDLEDQRPCALTGCRSQSSNYTSSSEEQILAAISGTRRLEFGYRGNVGAHALPFDGALSGRACHAPCGHLESPAGGVELKHSQ